MKLTFTAVLLTFFVFNLYAQKEFVLEGKIHGVADSTWFYLHNFDTEQTVDSVMVMNNAFTIKGEVEGPQRFYFHNLFTGDPSALYYKFLWIEPGTLTFEGTIEDFINAEVRGSAVQEQEEKLFALTKEIEVKMDSLTDKFREGAFSDDIMLAKARKFRDGLMEEDTEIRTQFIKDHPHFLVSAQHLTFMMKNIEKALTQELYEVLTPEIKASEYGTAIQKFLELNREFKTGDQYVDIKLSTPDGEEISLSDFKGKYVLLDFWASGCGPCRMEHPSILKLYNQYKDQGFEIYAVSLDKNKTQWTKAIEKDQITWPNVSDLKGHNGDVALMYGVYYIPTNYIISPEGYILAKDVRGKALEEKLEELFGTASDK